MAEPVKGSPEVDLQINSLINALKGFNKAVAKNGSFSMLGELVEELHRALGTASRNYGIKIAQKAGGDKGAAKSAAKKSFAAAMSRKR